MQAMHNSEPYPVLDRSRDFAAIRASLAGVIGFEHDEALLAVGDSLENLKKIPDHSVSLILTDPPYHSTKKDNIHGDTAFKSDADFLDWMKQYSVEWKRILRPNGTLFCYCSSEMSARLEVLFSEEFNILSQVVWTKPNEPGFDGWKQKMKKEALRQWYAHTERIIFAEPSSPGNLTNSWFANFLRDARKQSGLSGHQLTEVTGAYGKVNHGGAVSNWETGRNVPSREQYERICSAFLETGKVHSMPAYEDLIRPFNVNGNVEFTDVWTFPSVRPYKGKHPAEKPLSMLEHAIKATTYPGDIVIDCFSGSASTAMASLNLGRRTVSMEIDPKWIERTQSLLSARLSSGVRAKEIVITPEHKPKRVREQMELTL
jgi:adenine-specific DNA-methyltransferase